MATEYLKIAGVLLSLIGTIILSIRVARLLSTVAMAVQMHDLNFKSKAIRASGDNSVPFIQVHHMGKHVKNAEYFGTNLLITGFVFQIAGGACTALSFTL